MVVSFFIFFYLIYIFLWYNERATKFISKFFPFLPNLFILICVLKTSA